MTRSYRNMRQVSSLDAYRDRHQAWKYSFLVCKGGGEKRQDSMGGNDGTLALGFFLSLSMNVLLARIPIYGYIVDLWKIDPMQNEAHL